MKLENVDNLVAVAWKSSDIWSRHFSWALAKDMTTVLFLENEYQKVLVPKNTLWQSVVEFRVIKPFWIKTYSLTKSQELQLIALNITLRAQPAYASHEVIAQHPYEKGYGVYVPLSHLELKKEYKSMYGLS